MRKINSFVLKRRGTIESIRAITAKNPNVSISKPCPSNDFPIFPEKSADIKYARGIAHAVSMTRFLGSVNTPLFNLEIKNKKNAASMLIKIKSDFVNKNGAEIDGIKKIGRRNTTPTIM